MLFFVIQCNNSVRVEHFIHYPKYSKTDSLKDRIMPNLVAIFLVAVIAIGLAAIIVSNPVIGAFGALFGAGLLEGLRRLQA